MGDQKVCYHGYYSNLSRDKHKKADSDEPVPSMLQPEAGFIPLTRDEAESESVFAHSGDVRIVGNW